MGKDINHPNLPAVASVSMQAFMNSCRRDVNDNEMEQYHFALKRNIEHSPELITENPYQYWREHEGYSQTEMSDLLGMNLQDYVDIEQDERYPSVRFVEDFCCELDLHPVDLCLGNDILSPALIDVLIQTYKNPDDIDQLFVKNIEDKDILLEETNPHYSYFPLEEEMREREFSETFSNYVVSKLINQILINDGNPLTGGYTANGFIFAAIRTTEDDVKNGLIDDYTEAKEKRIIIGEQLDDMAGSIFGNDWSEYKKMLNDQVPKFGLDRAKSFLLNVFPGVNKERATDNQLSDIWCLFLSERNAIQNMLHKKSTLNLSVKRLEVLREFADMFEETLMAFDNRQAIMAQIPSFEVQSMGVENHPDYYNFKLIKQKPVALLPPPKPKP